MVLEVGVELALAVLPRAQQAPAVVAELGQNELGAGARRREVVGSARAPRPPPPAPRSQARSRRSGACRRALARRAWHEPHRAGGASRRAAAARRRPDEDVSPPRSFPARWRRTSRSPRPRRRRGGRAARRATRHRTCPLALGVGVERAVEAALRTAHLAQQPIERLLADGPGRGARRSPASRGGRRVRAARCRRASSRSGARASLRRPSSGSAAADLVADPACGHRPQGVQAQLGVAPAQKQLERRGGRTWARRRSLRALGRTLPAGRRAPRRRRARPAAAPRVGARLPRAGARPPARSRRGFCGSLCHACATASTTCGQLGIPRRGSGGSRCRRRTAPAQV